MTTDGEAKVKTSMYALRKRIENVIDRGEWKNSWHLPKDRYGFSDWFSPDTAKDVKQLLSEAIEQATLLLNESRSLMDAIDWDYYEQVRREREEEK